MAEIRNSPRNGLALLAENLKSGKQYLNQYEIAKWMPLIGGSGIGDLFMGQTPELVDDTSYYGLNSLLKGGNRATGGIGTLAPDNRTFDAAMLGLDLAGLTAGTSKLAGKGINKSLNKLFTGNTNQSRREFLKNSAALGGASALGITGLNIVDNILKEAGEQVTKKASDNVAKEVGEKVAKHKFNSLKEYNDYLNAKSREGYSSTFPQENTGYLNNVKRQLAKEDEALYNEVKAAKEQYLKYANDPEFGGYIDDFFIPDSNLTIDKALEINNAFSPQAKAEMRVFKDKYVDLSYDRAANKYSESLYTEPFDYDNLISREMDNDHWANYLDEYLKK